MKGREHNRRKGMALIYARNEPEGECGMTQKKSPAGAGLEKG
jgi:hypothetical protein